MLALIQKRVGSPLLPIKGSSTHKFFNDKKNFKLTNFPATYSSSLSLPFYSENDKRRVFVHCH